MEELATMDLSKDRTLKKKKIIQHIDSGEASP